MRNISGAIPAQAGARWTRAIGSLCLFVLTVGAASAAQTTLLNVSFDVSRQLFQQINSAFSAHWKAQSGEALVINQSHGGSTKQARAVIDGLDADVVTLNQASDIDAIAQKGKMLPVNWAGLLPNHSAPYTSTIIFLVRKGNPKGIRDWDDLVKPGVSVVVPNPKTSGNGRYSYLSAYAFALEKFGHDDAMARGFVADLFKNVPVLDTGGRGATTTFAERVIGDALVSFEAEILLAVKEHGDQQLEAVIPSQSLEAEMPVAVVEKVAQRRGTDRAARAYLEFLYTEEAQDIIARNFYRPRSATVAARYSTQFGKLKLVSVDEVFGGWDKVRRIHFADGGLFDQIYQARR
jgi:sulfate/thiosulfate transport system substrate-binding protein